MQIRLSRFGLWRTAIWDTPRSPEQGCLEKMIPFFRLLRFTECEEDNHIALDGNRFSSGMALGSR